MREQQVTLRTPGAILGQPLLGNTSRPGPSATVRRRQRAALADLRQAWGEGQPEASEKRLGVLAKTLGFLNHLW